MTRREENNLIAVLIGRKFLCFGRGTLSRIEGNPLAEALAEQNVQFALGVDVVDVVEFVRWLTTKANRRRLARMKKSGVLSAAFQNPPGAKVAKS